MKTFAMMSGNMVVNVIQGDSLESVSVLGTCIEYTSENPAGIGWTWDGTKFVKPEIPKE